MSKTMKISFEMPGTQVDANYFSNEVLDAIKKMTESGESDNDEIIDYIREHREGTGINVSNGIFVHADELKCTIEDGDDKLNVSLMCFNSSDDETYDELVEENELQDAEAILAVDLDNEIFLTKGDGPSKDQHVMLEIANYMDGQLVGFFEVDDNTTVKDIDMKDFAIQTLNVDGEGEISEITYSEGTVGTEHESEVHKLSYKDNDIELGLNFQGGSGEVQLFIRDEDGDLVETEIEDLND